MKHIYRIRIAEDINYTLFNEVSTEDRDVQAILYYSNMGVERFVANGEICDSLGYKATESGWSKVYDFVYDGMSKCINTPDGPIFRYFVPDENHPDEGEFESRLAKEGETFFDEFVVKNGVWEIQLPVKIDPSTGLPED